MKSSFIVKILIVNLIFLLSTSTCFSQEIMLPSVYVGTNRFSLSSKYDVLNPGWGGQLGFNTKVGSKWIQFDASLEFDVKGLRKKYSQTMTAETGRTMESNNSITSYALHAVIPLGISIGYYAPEIDNSEYNILGASLVGGGFIDLGIWGENRLKQENRLSNTHIINEESTVYTQNCFGGNALQRKRFDAGIYFGIAATTQIIGVSIVYRKGFLNVSNIDKLTCNNNGLYINLTINCTYEN